MGTSFSLPEDKNFITEKIVENCNAIKDPNGDVIFFARGQIILTNSNDNKAIPDIFFTDEDTTIEGYSKEFRPLMIIEVGMKGEEWWDKFDQCVQYLDMMSELKENQLVTFDRPLLMSVITIDKDNTTGDIKKLKIGVFFCHPKREQMSTRVVLLWHKVSTDMEDASNSFGKVLEVTTHFQKLVNETTRDLSSELKYEYFSSNCCKTGNRVRDRHTWLVAAMQAISMIVVSSLSFMSMYLICLLFLVIFLFSLCNILLG
jgi:hypothetical protein